MPSVEEVTTNIQMMKQNEIVEMTEALASMMIESMTAAGVPLVPGEHNTKDLCLFVESLKSLIAKQYNVEHPLQLMADNCFEIDEEGGMHFKAVQFRFNDISEIKNEGTVEGDT